MAGKIMSPPPKRFRLPPLADHHSHPLLYAALYQGVDLSDVTTAEEAWTAIAGASNHAEMVVGFGWKNNRFELDAEPFDRLGPAAVFNLSLHDLRLNRAGHALLRERFGEAVDQITNRAWFEANLVTVWNWFADLAGSAAALIDFFRFLEGEGVVSAEEMLLVGPREMEWFEQCGLRDRTRFWCAPETWESLASDQQKELAGTKLFADGAFGSRTAAVAQPYTDAPDNRGMLLYSDGDLERAVCDAAARDRGLAVHAIGDRAIEQVIRTLEKIGPTRDRFPEIRIEHAQLIDRDQAQRCLRMGVTLSMQPNFTVDSVDYLDRLGARRVALNNPFRMLIDEVGFEPGKNLILGSDGMPHGPLAALQASLFPPFPGQQLSLDEFRAGYGAVGHDDSLEFEIRNRRVERVV